MCEEAAVATAVQICVHVLVNRASLRDGQVASVNKQ